MKTTPIRSLPNTNPIKSYHQSHEIKGVNLSWIYCGRCLYSETYHKYVLMLPCKEYRSYDN